MRMKDKLIAEISTGNIDPKSHGIISISAIKDSIMNPADKRMYTTEVTVSRIIRLTEEITDFWKSPNGWAPLKAAELLTKSRLDWQASLARQLELFLDKSNTESGYVILAWVTLGSLLEGTLKLFLSVYYKDYHIQNITQEYKKVKVWKGNLIEPDELTLDKLRLFFKDKVFPKDAKDTWNEQGEIDWLDWIYKIQKYRNAIHAFKSREIGDMEEFYSELKNYLIFLRKVNNSLPYPDEVYKPFEDISDNNIEKISIKIDGILIKGVIKEGKLFVASKKDGVLLKKHLGKSLKKLVYDTNEIEIVDQMLLSNW